MVLDNCRGITYNRMRTNIFAPGVNTDIDEMMRDYVNYRSEIQEIIGIILDYYASRVKIALSSSSVGGSGGRN